MADKKTASKTILLPVGRLINHSLFERDIYKDEKTGAEGKPLYKAEVAFDPADVTGKDSFEDACADVIEEEWGADAANDFLDGKEGYFTPFKDGDALAADRAARGKEGDAYKGKLVLRVNTKWNAEGEDGPGGVHVVDEDAETISFADRGKVFNGSYGILAVTLKPREEDEEYTENRVKKTRKMRGVTVYLKGWQRTGGEDADRLKSATANPFKPTGRVKPGAGEPVVRRRRG